MASALLLASSAFAQTPTLNWYGFVRNYFVYDSHESSAGTEELYYYMPKDSDNKGTANWSALTSRLGLDVKGYEIQGYKIAAKIETDFYLKNGTTATLRMRQAYLTVGKNDRSWKIGQAWHPMAADFPDIFSLEIGVPFGPFSRTPQINFDYKVSEHLNVNAVALWQMQYTSTGPDGAVANYIKYSGIPEIYAGIGYKDGNGLIKAGVDVLSIKPVQKMKHNLTTVNFFEYGQVKAGDWLFKEKIVFTQDGSHMNLVGGYGVSGISQDGDYIYTPTQTLTGWASITYKKSKTWVPVLFIGALKCFGTKDEVIGDFWCKNSAANVSAMYRIQPEITYNLGKLQLGAEWMFTAVNYGKPDAFKQASDNLHWVKNNRLQMIVKYSF